MKRRLLLLALFIVLFALVSARTNLNEEQSGRDTAIAGHENSRSLAYDEAEVLQAQGSLSANHQEAKGADTLLNELIKKLNQRIAEETEATNLKVEERNKGIKKFDDAVTLAKTFLDDLSSKKTALVKQLDDATVALSGRQAERVAAQKEIVYQNAEERVRLAERIADVEKQIMFIRQILRLLSDAPVDVNVPDSIILDDAQERLIPNLFTGTPWAGKKFQRCYRAADSGYSTEVYHSACDNKGPTIAIIKSASGNIFGAFASVNFSPSSNPAEKHVNFLFKDDNSFLFSVYRAGETKLVKLPRISEDAGPVGGAYSGPYFGGRYGTDLYINDKCNANTDSSSDLGNYYSSDGNTGSAAKKYLAGSEKFQCADWEVFVLV